MTPDDQFQKTHGKAWAKILETPSFNAGATKVISEALDDIEKLSPDDIQKFASVHLSAFQGMLKYQRGLLSLPIPPQPASPEIVEEYPNAVEENFAEHQRQNTPGKKKS